jgi:hypothetical protein
VARRLGETGISSCDATRLPRCWNVVNARFQVLGREGKFVIALPFDITFAGHRPGPLDSWWEGGAV